MPRLHHAAVALIFAAGFGAGPVAAMERVTDGANQSLTVACAGQPAAITGSANHVTFTGPCPSLRIAGDRNVVSIDLGRAATVKVTGNYNQVVYAPAAPPPVTTLRGYYNQVVPGPAGSGADTLVLDGALGRRDVPCGGLDVVIRESQARYVLRGGCRSITVMGESDTVAAELLPSARLVIGGIGVVVNYILTAQGAPPSVVVTVPGARATHVARFGESAMILPVSAGLPAAATPLPGTPLQAGAPLQLTVPVAR